ncbi:MAG TPA: translocation/assembly module TamB domain-containing protein [Casimicrobiaceae bacterium]|nr:translocation/assembly module TamB domain-containing protein [Casimicrobiaceae bacterium]
MATARVSRIGAAAAAIVALAAIALVATGLWLAHTDAGLRWVSGQAMARTGGRLSIEGATGSLGGRVRIARLTYDDDDLKLVADDVAFTWSPRALFTRSIVVDDLSAAAVGLQLKPSAGPSQPPASLALPWPIDVRRADIALLTVESGPNRWQVRRLGFHYIGAADRHALDALALDSEWGSLHGNIAVAAEKPFAAVGSIDFAGSEAARRATGTVVIGGDLATLSLSGEGIVDAAHLTGTARVAPFEPRRLRDFDLKVDGADLARFDARLPQTGFSATLTGTGTDDGGARGTLVAHNALAGAWSARRLPLASIASGFAVGDYGVRLDGLDASLGDAGRIRGDAAFERDIASWKLDVRDLDLHGIADDLKPTRLAGALSGRMHLDASEPDGEVSGDLRQSDVALAFRATAAHGTVDVSTFRARARGGSVQGSGRLALGGAQAFSADLRASALDPAAFGDYPPARLSGNATLRGTLKPSWTAVVAFQLGKGSSLRGHALTGTGKLAVSPGVVRDARVDLAIGANRLQAGGDFGHAGDTLRFVVAAHGLSQLDASLGGRVDASGSVGGSWQRPTLALNATGDHLHFGTELSATTLTADVAIDAGTGRDPDRPLRIGLVAGGVRAGTLDAKSMRAGLDGTLAQHHATIAVIGVASDVDIDLDARLKGGWSGDARSGTWVGRIVALENRGKYPLALTQAADVEAAAHKVEVANLRGTIAGGRFDVEQLRWQQGRLSSRGDFTALPAAPLFALTGAAPRVSSTLTLGGRWSFAATPRITGNLSFRRENGDLAPIDAPDLALGLSSADLEAEFVDDRMHATLTARSRLVNADVVAELGASPEPGGRFGAGAPLDLTARLDASSLRALQGLVGTNAIVDGRLKLDLSGRGTLSKVRLSGSIEGDALKIEAPQYGVALKDGRLRARLTDEAAIISELSFAAGDGRFTANGTLPASGGAEGGNLSWKADRLALFERPDMRLVLSGAGTLSMSNSTVRLAGALKADEGYFEFRPPTADAPGPDVVVRGREREPQRSGLQRVPFAVDLDLDFGDKLTFVGEGFDTVLGGRMHVQTTAARDLEARGTVRVVRGTYTTFGQRLTIQRGRLSFDGPLDNPGLDVVALRKNLPVEAGVEVTGTVRVPRVTLTSNPPLPDNEKLAWLVLGHGLENASSADAALLQAALAALAGPNASPFGQRFARTLGVDEISVHAASDPSRTGTAGQVVAFSKRLSDKLTLVYEQGLSVANNALKLEYSLSRTVTLRAEAGVVSGIGVYYSRAYD